MTCKHCGDCCEYVILASAIDLQETELSEYIDWLQDHGIEVIRRGNAIMSRIKVHCVHRRSSRCDIYEKRPGICRNYICEVDKTK